ncbi:uncharacterized protein LOC144924149 [Branchiostoma floridae x Branchiostoma belcheri]
MAGGRVVCSTDDRHTVKPFPVLWSVLTVVDIRTARLRRFQVGLSGLFIRPRGASFGITAVTREPVPWTTSSALCLIKTSEDATAKRLKMDLSELLLLVYITRPVEKSAMETTYAQSGGCRLDR